MRRVLDFLGVWAWIARPLLFVILAELYMSVAPRTNVVILFAVVWTVGRYVWARGGEKGLGMTESEAIRALRDFLADLRSAGYRLSGDQDGTVVLLGERDGIIAYTEYEAHGGRVVDARTGDKQ